MDTKLPMAPQNEGYTFIIKTSFDCNLNCAYCYEGHRVRMPRMTLDTVKAFTEQAKDYSKRTGAKFTFVWHGGEPLMMGRDFYKKGIAYQKTDDQTKIFANSLQTNGVLLTKDMAKTLQDLGVGVGVSLDGPPVIHDAQRFLKGKGGGSFMQAYEALRTLYEIGVDAGALAVFTRNTYEHMDEFYDFFSQRDLHLKMHPLFLGGNADEEGSKYLQVTPKEYTTASIYLFNRWIADSKKSFSFDPYESLVRSLTSGRTYSCDQSGQCSNFFKIFPNGDAHLCGLMPYEKHKLGNIHKDSFETLLKSPLREAYAKARASLSETCGKSCDYFPICHGGCVSYSYPLSGRHSDKTFYCESQKALLNYMSGMVAGHKVRLSPG